MKRRGGALIKGPLWYSFYEAPAPVGRLYVASDIDVVVGVGAGVDKDEFLKRLARGQGGELEFRKDEKRFTRLFREFDRYFAGRPVSFSTAVNLHGTLFEEAVWRALKEIPRGSTRSYGEVASIIGRPRAVRAVGGACAANPLPIIIPCHRVIRAHGAMGGYTGGVGIKRALLALEGILIEGR